MIANNSASRNNPSPNEMLMSTLQLIQEQDGDPLSPASFGSSSSVGSPADSQGSYCSLPGLQHDQFSPMNNSSPNHNHINGFPTNPFQTNHYYMNDFNADTIMQNLGHSSNQLPMSHTDLAGSPSSTSSDTPYLTPPRDPAWFPEIAALDGFVDDLLSDPYSPSSVDLANELNTSGTSCDLTHSLSNIGGMTGPRDYEPAAAPVSFRAPSNAFSSNSTPFSSNSTVFSSNSTPFSSNSTVSKPMSYVQPMLNAMPHCPNNVSASSVFDQAHCIPAPTGRQWMAVPPAQFPNMHTLPKDAFPKPYGKTDLPIVALWEFLLEALYYSSYEHILKWKNKQEGDFKIVNSSSLAKLWGVYKRKKDMNFDKMSRAMRYYYDKGILEKGSSGARLEYKFGPRSNWLDFKPPHGAENGRFFQSQPPRRARGNRSIAPNLSKESKSPAAPNVVTEQTVVAPATSIPLSHPPMPQQQTLSQHGRHAFPKPAACATQHRFTPY
ncbi:uncharacterized protein LOC135815913 [Sycon ciliatum]|uniref:uncharacterized protein LOC135815913 n=1 Tax=Sycon ciliatum TaxID=27933 RepID=UPI0031F65C68|eukprot:scpid96125/ scgid1540/ ETS domain-containing protein Elk-1